MKLIPSSWLLVDTFEYVRRCKTAEFSLISKSQSDVRDYTLKKIGTLRNPLKKKFRRNRKASKDVRSLKKRIKKSTKPLKVLPVYPGAEPFKSEIFLSSVEQKKVS